MSTQISTAVSGGPRLALLPDAPQVDSSTTNLTQAQSHEEKAGLGFSDVPLSMPIPETAPVPNEQKRPPYKKHANSSFDALRSGQWSRFTAAESKHNRFQFAEGDVPKSKVSCVCTLLRH